MTDEERGLETVYEGQLILWVKSFLENTGLFWSQESDQLYDGLLVSSLLWDKHLTQVIRKEL